MLVMSGLMYAGQWFMFSAFEFSLTRSLRIIAICASIGLCVLLPVTGWVAESWLGRYPAIIVGLNSYVHSSCSIVPSCLCAAAI